MKGTIKSSLRITQLFEEGTRFSSAGFLALYVKNVHPAKENNKNRGRIAYIAGKKLGSAPVRSRAKRRLREAAQTLKAPWDEYDVVLVAKPQLLKIEYRKLVSDLRRLREVLEPNKGTEKDNHKRRNNKEAEEKTNINKRESIVTFIVGIPRTIALLCIKVYRHAISPLLPPSCRYVPSCSEYAMIALKRFGFWKGLWLSVKRVGRCHPFVEGGYDPVPEISTEASIK